MRRLTAGLAAFGMLWGLAGCVGPPRQAAPPAGQAATAGAARPGATVKQRNHHLSGRHLDLAVHYPRTFRGRRYLASEWHPVPYTRAVAAAAVGELLGAEPDCPGVAPALPGRHPPAGDAPTGRPRTGHGPGLRHRRRGRPWPGPFSATFTPPAAPMPGPWRPSRSAPRTAGSSTRSTSRSGWAADLTPVDSRIPRPLGSATLPHWGTRRRRVRVRHARRWVRGAGGGCGAPGLGNPRHGGSG
jgi:hypothetical protein